MCGILSQRRFVAGVDCKSGSSTSVFMGEFKMKKFVIKSSVLLVAAGIAAGAILSGAKGVISVTANVAPRLMHEMSVAALAGDRANTEAIDQQLTGLHQALFLESNPIPVKWAVSQLGLIPPGIRLPLTPLSESFHLAVRAAMQQAGVL